VLRNWWYEEHRRQGFVSLTTPAFVKTSQLRKFGEEGGQELPVLSVSDFDRVILPSRSPLHALYFRTHLHSYRELPVRYAECAQVYNLKKDGELWGIFNTLFVEADAAHIFCSAEQVEKELISSLQFIDKITKILGFELYWCLGGRASKSAGTLRQWEAMTLQMQRAFEACNFECFLDKEAPSFAGPVAQAYVVDALGREWKGPRLAIDFNYTERLGLRYQAATDSMEMPIMLIRTIFGSLERWIALLLEHFGGMLPLWLAPEQVRVLSVGEGCKEYAETVASALENKGLRVGVDFRPEQLGKKIHQCENKRIPYLVIVGEKEKKQDLLTVRSGYSDQVQGGVNLENFLNQVKEEIENKSLPDTNRKDKHRR
jgi:threonyl-tRNA synthetase